MNQMLERMLGNSCGAIRIGKALPEVRSSLLAIGAVCAMLAGCTGLARNAVPVEQIEAAAVPGMPAEVRALGLAPSPVLQHDFSEAIVEGGLEQACDEREGQPVFCVLVISGGGGFGAYGAGLLNGWTASGERPAFKIVTGVSTGSLIAPFAFLGPAWDEELRVAYTSITGDDDVVTSRGVLGLLTATRSRAASP